jgi:hypothetical protein
MSSIALLVLLDIWSERNARVIRKKIVPPFVVLDKIRKEARLWMLAGAN